MEHRLNAVDKFPYPFSDYLKRIVWIAARLTIWKILWHRIPWLRMLLLKLFGGRVHFSGMAYGSVNIFRPWGFSMGKYVALGPRVNVYNLANITIGDSTVISQDAYLCGGTHDYSKATLPLQRKNITIGSNVWICAGAFIGPGVRVGDGAVIGARSVVMKDVEPWTVVGGNPATFIKKRTILE